MTEYRVVIDQSTSATKALLFDTDNGLKLLDRVDKPHQQIYPKIGFVEHDPIEIIENTKTVIEILLSKNGLAKDEISSLSITNQRESILFWDRKTGIPYGNVMVWQCNRGLDLCEQLETEGHATTIETKTGLKLDPYFSGTKVRWMIEHQSFKPEQLSNLCVGTIDTWLIWNLTNGQKFVTDPSNACRTLLYNIHTQSWDVELCELFKIPVDVLPKVIESDGDFGDYEGIPIISVLADSQAALYGHGCVEEGTIKATLGTGSSLLLNLGESVDLPDSSLLKTIAWRKHGKTVYGLEGAIKSYGDILNWLRDQLGLFDSYQQGMDLAMKLKSNEHVYFIPALEDLSAPFWKPDAHASFVGMSRKTNFIHLIRAAVESMCYQTRAAIDAFRNDSGYAITTIHMDGGSVKNPKFMQLLADIAQIEIVVGDFEELSALGALLISSASINYKATISKTYYPQVSYEESYKEWLGHIKLL